MLRRPGGPTYEVIIDEVAVSRLAAPPEVVKKQLYYLATSVNGEPKVTVRVLPVHARIKSYAVPRCTFSMYTYPDPGDPSVVAVDTVTSDLILTDAADVHPYEELYQRLQDAALPPDDSLDVLTKLAADLPDDLPALASAGFAPISFHPGRAFDVTQSACALAARARLTSGSESLNVSLIPMNPKPHRTAVCP